MSLPSRDQIDEYISSIEEYISSSFTTVVPDIPAISESIHRLWLDLSRFGPPELPEIHLPGLGTFEVPAPPPPPPPPAPLSNFEEVAHWASRHRKLVGTACICALGAGLLAGYSASAFARTRAKTKHVRKTTGIGSSTRTLVVVVLGADSPLGPALISGLEKEGYIVIASVSTPDAVDDIESIGRGYVRALVLDPTEPATIPYFLRSLQATFSLRFPLTASGDPYQQSPLAIPHLHSVISLLSLPSPKVSPPPQPFEHLGLSTTYKSYLTLTHITPLRIVQELLPLFRASPVRAHGDSALHGGVQSVVLCVPATDARVGVPYASAQAMSAAATVRGAEVLRRELLQVRPQPVGDVRVVVVDVGAVGETRSPYSPFYEQQEWESMVRAVGDWTPGEQSVYAASYLSFLGFARRHVGRRPASIHTFVNAIVSTVGKNAAKGKNRSTIVIGLRLWRNSLHRWVRGSRFSVGAGAVTYTIASYLPSILLDALLNLPAFLISLRVKYAHIAPSILPVKEPVVPNPRPIERKEATENNEPSFVTEANGQDHIHSSTEISGSGAHDETAASDSSSDASGSGQADGPPSSSAVDSSWISVQE